MRILSSALFWSKANCVSSSGFPQGIYSTINQNFCEVERHSLRHYLPLVYGVKRGTCYTHVRPFVHLVDASCDSWRRTTMAEPFQSMGSIKSHTRCVISILRWLVVILLFCYAILRRLTWSLAWHGGCVGSFCKWVFKQLRHYEQRVILHSRVAGTTLSKERLIMALWMLPYTSQKKMIYGEAGMCNIANKITTGRHT